MALLPAVTIDVRDMVCAQALMLVAQALTRIPHGGVLEVLTNTEDVARDLIVWATQRGDSITEVSAGILRITRRL